MAATTSADLSRLYCGSFVGIPDIGQFPRQECYFLEAVIDGFSFRSLVVELVTDPQQKMQILHGSHLISWTWQTLVYRRFIAATFSNAAQPLATAGIRTDIISLSPQPGA
jgi:hypothetical protein